MKTLDWKVTSVVSEASRLRATAGRPSTTPDMTGRPPHHLSSADIAPSLPSDSCTAPVAAAIVVGLAAAAQTGVHSDLDEPPPSGGVRTWSLPLDFPPTPPLPWPCLTPWSPSNRFPYRHRPHVELEADCAGLEQAEEARAGVPKGAGRKLQGRCGGVLRVGLRCVGASWRVLFVCSICSVCLFVCLFCLFVLFVGLFVCLFCFGGGGEGSRSTLEDLGWAKCCT